MCRVGSTSEISPESYPIIPVSSSVATTKSAGEQIFITMKTVARCSNTEEGQVSVFQKLDNTTQSMGVKLMLQQPHASSTG